MEDENKKVTQNRFFNPKQNSYNIPNNSLDVSKSQTPPPPSLARNSVTPTMRVMEPPPSNSPYFQPQMSNRSMNSSPGIPPPASLGVDSTPIKEISGNLGSEALNPSVPMKIEPLKPKQVGNKERSEGNGLQAPSFLSYPECYELETYSTSSISSTSSYQIPPPSIGTRFCVHWENGNCNPRFMRSTLYQIPNSYSLLKKTGLYFGLFLTPLAELDALDRPNYISKVEHLEAGGGPIRCSRCRCYLNLFSEIQNGGRSYFCNLCGFNNVLPDWYATGYVDPITGGPRGYEERPELRFASVDFFASKEYCSRYPVPPLSILFVIDLASPLEAIFQAIKLAISQQQQQQQQNNKKMMNVNDINGSNSSIGSSGSDGNNSKYGFLFYGKSVEIFNISGHPSLCMMMNTDDPYVPLPEKKVFVPSSQVSDYLDRILQYQIKQYKKNNDKTINETSSVSCFGAAMIVAQELLSATGGRIVAFATKIPNVGRGTLVARGEDGNNSKGSITAEKERELFGPQDGFWKQLGESSGKNQIACDLFLFPLNRLMEASTLGYICNKTCGQMYIYPRYSAAADEERLQFDIKKLLLRNTCYDAILKVRCSNGLSVRSYSGNFLRHANDDIDLPGVDSCASFYCELKHDLDLPVDKAFAYVQCAMLYTSQQGVRLIRVHTLQLPVVNNHVSLFRTADRDAHFAAILRQSTDLISKNRDTLEVVRKFTIDALVAMLAVYRKECSKGAGAGQLVLPDAFRLLPLLVLGLQKSTSFNSDQLSLSNMSSIDEKVVVFNNLYRMSLEAIIRYAYPVLYPLHHNILSQKQQQQQQSSSSSIALHEEDEQQQQQEEEEEEEEDGEGEGDGNGEQYNNTDHIEAGNSYDLQQQKNPNFSKDKDNDEDIYKILPPPLALSSSKISQEGAYLLCDFRNIFIWVGKKCPIEVIIALFGPQVTCWDDIKVDSPLLMLSNSSRKSSSSTSISSSSSSLISRRIAKRMRRILNYLKETSYLGLKTIIAKPGLSSEAAFFNRLVEDRTISSQSYMDLLSFLHKEIQARVQ